MNKTNQRPYIRQNPFPTITPYPPQKTVLTALFPGATVIVTVMFGSPSQSVPTCTPFGLSSQLLHCTGPAAVELGANTAVVAAAGGGKLDTAAGGEADGKLVVAAADASGHVGDAEPKADADADPTCEVTPVTPLTGVLISKKLAGSAVPSPWAERIWGRLTGHAPCRLFFNFDSPGEAGQFHAMMDWMASWMWIRMARRTSHAPLSFETCWGTYSNVRRPSHGLNCISPSLSTG